MQQYNDGGGIRFKEKEKEMMVEEETMVLGFSSRRRYLNGDFEEEGGE